MSAAEALSRIPIGTYEVAVIDVVPGTGIQDVREFTGTRPLSPVVVTGAIDSRDVLGFAERGVDACVTQNVGLAKLVETILTVSSRRERYSGCLVVTALRSNGDLTAESSDQSQDLTPREVEVLDLINLGLSNKQIGQQLHIELATVKNHVHSILHKLDVHSRSLAAAWRRAHR